MPELWLRKTYPVVKFINTNLPEKRFRACCSEEEILDLPEESTNVYKRNMLDRYTERPDKNFNKGKFAVVDKLCFAEFYAYYYLDLSKWTENDCQPEVLEDEVIEKNHDVNVLPATIPLMSEKKEKLKCRKVKAVLRYHVPNHDKKPEEYAHHILMMYYPFRSESELCQTESGTYAEKLLEPDVIAVVNENKLKIEPCSELVDDALSNLSHNLRYNHDSYAQQENDEVTEILQVTDALLVDPDDEPVLFDESEISPSTSFNTISLKNDDEINTMISSLNEKQSQIFNVVMKWARNYIKYLSCAKEKNSTALFIYNWWWRLW